MPDINVKGRYRIYTHDGVEPLPFTSYSNSLCSIRRPNPNTFITISTYIPGSLSPFTTFDPGSSYTIVTKSNTADFSMGPYTRVDRLPSSVTFRSPNFYHGLDKNSITVALSSYALSVNAPLSTAFTYIPNQNGYFINSISFNTERLKEGLPSLLTHLTPNSSYQFINRTPFTFFAPLQSEMGDAYAIGNNDAGEYGMGHRYTSPAGSPSGLYSYGLSAIAVQTFGIWDKIVTSNSYQPVTASGQIFSATSFAALSTCGNSKAIFVLGDNSWGQLGTGNDRQYYATWTKISGVWKDVELGSQHMIAINPSGHLYACGRNSSGQLGLGSGTLSANTLTLVDDSRNYVELAPGGSSTAVRDSLGRIWVCGNNLNGQLGLNNTTTPIYTLTQEATNSTWTKVRSGKSAGYMVALKENKLFGTGANSNYFGSGSSGQKNIFTQEILGLTDIEDFFISIRGTYIKRTGQYSLFASGYNGISTRSLLSTSPASATTLVYFTKTNIPSDAKKIISTDSGTGTVGYIQNNRFFTKAYPRVFEIFSNFNVYEVFPEMSNTLFMIKDGIRPTPTPTPTVTPTPSPVPFAPYNALQIGIFGSYSVNAAQEVFYNTPGNLSNNFIHEDISYGNFPPGDSYMTTFDFEKTTTFNNIVGINVLKNDTQCPPGRKKCRYLFRRTGSNWNYTLLPATFDAVSGSNIWARYRTSETGADNLFITPQHPEYFGTEQGVYFLMFMRNLTFHEARSFDRGVNWTIYPFLGPFPGDSNFNTTQQGMCKIIYSRTRGANYQVHVVGYSDDRLYFSQRFPGYPGGLENISDIDYAWGFDFKHDYNNIPTVVSHAIDRDSPGRPYLDVWGRLLIHRKIGNTWQTNIIKAAMNSCLGPNYKVPYGVAGIYLRMNSPTMSIEFDSRNPSLIYVAYLLSPRVGLDGSGSQDPTYINVLCYNMNTNSIVFDENVVKTRSYYPGEYILISNSHNIDIPMLYFDTADNSLNLFFIGSEGAPLTPNPVRVRYFKTRRLGTNSWASISDLDTTYSYTQINRTCSRELKIKY